MKDFIKHKINKSKYYLLYNKIPFTIINDKNIILNIKDLIVKIESIIPNSKLFRYIDNIYIGNFDFLKTRQIHAMYIDNCIYILNVNTNLDLITKDIIHELAHSLENEFGIDLYGDSELDIEYTKKKKFILQTLKNIGYSVDKDFFIDNEYMKEFDLFLYDTVGYSNLAPLIVNIFISPYSITSLSEYYANGFEMFFTGDKNSLQKTCPVLYSKINEVCTLIKNSRQ